MILSSGLPKGPAKFLPALAASLLFLFCFLFAYQHNSFSLPSSPKLGAIESKPHISDNSTSKYENIDSIQLTARYFLDYPLGPPYKDVFGELGERAQLLQSWIELLNEDFISTATKHDLRQVVEEVMVSLFPYLKPLPDRPHNATLLAQLLSHFDGSELSRRRAGIVIPTGQRTLRYAAHLLASLTRVHGTTLPVEIVYAGDDDLPVEGRETLKKAGEGLEIQFVDALDAFDDTTLQLAKGGWAIKPFAILASSFDQAILLDADAVFIQAPEQLLKQQRYQETGVFLFHDRLLWKGGFPERQEWWHKQIRHPSPERNKSLVWTEGYSEEGDSGVVVVDKSRLDVLIGLLHIGWQNSYDVREEWTYKVTYGDKETYWIGFEAVGASYAFSGHYGGMVGWLSPLPEETNEDGVSGPPKSRVCSFVIAHVDDENKLLWYNGGLLKNKLANNTEFEVPTHWMMDQEWHKGGKKDMSCMVGSDVSELTKEETELLGLSIDAAKEVDSRLKLIY